MSAAYAVRLSPAAVEALEEASAFIASESGPNRASDWLRTIKASVERLEAFPRAFPVFGHREGVTIRSKVALSHRIFYFVDEERRVVYVIDVVHSTRETRLARYRP